MTNEISRTELRRKLRAVRHQLTGKEELSYAVAQKILAHPYLQESRLIASYQSLPDELDTHRLNQALLEAGHTLVLPLIAPRHRGQMSFYRVERLDGLVNNAYGISEPKEDEALKVSPDYIEILIVPLVGFDLRGDRLGMGGGYYDRMLKKISISCLSLGLAFDEQEADPLPVEPWDMPVDEVITPSRHLIFCPKY